MVCMWQYPKGFLFIENKEKVNTTLCNKMKVCLSCLGLQIVLKLFAWEQKIQNLTINQQIINKFNYSIKNNWCCQGNSHRIMC